MEYMGIIIALILMLLSGSFWMGRLSVRVSALEDEMSDIKTEINEYNKEQAKQYVAIKVKLASIEVTTLLIKENQEKK